jgi:hypothetical protein
VFRASDAGADAELIGRLVAAYADVRAGLGMNKTPEEYGAFPTDAYSHTPAVGGAKQPGMTGQVKEDILCRWGELGVRVIDGCIAVEPVLLRSSEFLSAAATFEFMDVNGHLRSMELEPGSLAFTCCQTPVVYRRAANTAIRIVHGDGSVALLEGSIIDRETSAAVFARSGAVSRVEVDLVPGC